MAGACPEVWNCFPSNLLDRVVDEYRQPQELFPRSRFEKFQAVALIVLEQRIVSLIERVTPESRQSTSGRAIKPRVEHRSHAVKPHAECRPNNDVPQKVTESMVTRIPACARFEDSTDFSHHKRLIRVWDRYIAEQAVEHSRSQR